jgi:hypothetical protein
VLLYPGLILCVKSGHVKGDPVTLEVCPVFGILVLGTRNFGGRVVFLLYAFGFVSTILIVLPIISFVTVILCSTVVLKQGSLLFLNLLS